MNKLIQIFFGLVLLAVSILAWGANLAGFGEAAVVLLKGAIMWLVVLIGLVLVILGMNGLRN